MYLKIQITRQSLFANGLVETDLKWNGFQSKSFFE